MNKLDLLTMIAAGAGAGLFALGYALDAFTGAEFLAAMVGIAAVVLTIINNRGE